MVEKSGQESGAGRLKASAATMRSMLAQAEASLEAGDSAEAERGAKAVLALVRAAREVAELEAFARAQPPEEDEEAIRAELRRRVARFVEAEQSGAPVDVLKRIGAGASSE